MAQQLFVKVLTDQPGLYGIGSASDHYRARVVQAAVETVAPLLIGRDASRIEDIWQSVHTCGYWRNDAVTNTVQSGIDMALWDIKGKEAGARSTSCSAARRAARWPPMPMRRAILSPNSRTMCAAIGKKATRSSAASWAIMAAAALDRASARGPKNHWPQDKAFDDDAYLKAIPEMFAHLRDKLGWGPKFTHDVHEHLAPTNAVQLAKLLEPYRLYFLEDLLSPEQVG